MKVIQMSPSDAVRVLVFDYASDRKRSKASFRRVHSALDAVWIKEGSQDYIRCMQTLGYFADGCTKPYERYA